MKNRECLSMSFTDLEKVCEQNLANDKENCEASLCCKWTAS